MIRFTFILFLLPILSFSQFEKDTFEVVTLQQPQKFYLNSGGRSLIGGQSRIVIPVTLPENTLEWYYTLTTMNAQTKSAEMENQSDKISNKLHLTEQLAKLVVKGINMAADFNPASFAVSLAATPSGGEMCDIYLLDKENSKRFLAKEDHAFVGKGFVYQREGTKENFNSGNVAIKSIKNGTWYLGISNPTALSGMYVSVEIAAIIKMKRKLEVPENVQKASLYFNLAQQQFNDSNYDKCLEYCQKAIELNAANPLSYFKIGLCKIVLGDSTNPIDDYIAGITLAAKMSETARSVLNIALNEIKKVSIQNDNAKDLIEVKRLLENEIKKYPNIISNSK